MAPYRAPWLRMGLKNTYWSAWKMGCRWYYTGNKEGIDKYKGFARSNVAKEFTGCKSAEKYSHPTRSTRHLFTLSKKVTFLILLWNKLIEHSIVKLSLSNCRLQSLYPKCFLQSKTELWWELQQGNWRRKFRGFTLADTIPSTHYSAEFLFSLLKSSCVVWLAFTK